MEATVYNIKGESTGRSVELSNEIFAVEPRDHSIYLDVKQYLANQRQGTHKSKERGEISGSTRKIKKQKGTGGARAGSIKSPLFKGGGRIFGPRPRDYSFKLNKKVKRLARLSALSYKATANDIIVLEDFVLDTPKTAEFLAIKNNLDISGKKTLWVLPEENKNVYLSARNLPGVQIITPQELNTYSLLYAQKLVLCEGAISKLGWMLGVSADVQ